MGCCMSTASMPDLVAQKYTRGQYIDESLAFSNNVQIALPPKLLHLHGDDFKIKDAKGDILAKVSGKALNFDTTMALLNLRNVPLLSVKRNKSKRGVYHIVKIAELGRSGDFGGLAGYRSAGRRNRLNAASLLSRTDSASTLSTDMTDATSTTEMTATSTEDTTTDASSFTDTSYFSDDGGRSLGDQRADILYTISAVKGDPSILARIYEGASVGSEGDSVYDVKAYSKRPRLGLYAFINDKNQSVCNVAPKLFEFEHYSGFHVEIAPYCDVILFISFAIAMDAMLREE